MTRRAAQLGTLLLVTGEADFGLGILAANLVFLAMYVMAGVAGNIAAGVGAGLPVDAIAALMAADAGLVADCRGRLALLAEYAVRFGRL